MKTKIIFMCMLGGALLATPVSANAQASKVIQTISKVAKKVKVKKTPIKRTMPKTTRMSSTSPQQYRPVTISCTNCSGTGYKNGLKCSSCDGTGKKKRVIRVR